MGIIAVIFAILILLFVAFVFLLAAVETPMEPQKIEGKALQIRKKYIEDFARTKFAESFIPFNVFSMIQNQSNRKEFLALSDDYETLYYVKVDGECNLHDLDEEISGLNTRLSQAEFASNLNDFFINIHMEIMPSDIMLINIGIDELTLSTDNSDLPVLRFKVHEDKLDQLEPYLRRIQLMSLSS